MKTSNKILLIAFGLLLIGIVSLMLIIRKELSKEPLDGSGRAVKDLREAFPFMDVDISGELKVYLQQGDSLSVMIEADDNLLDFIDTSIKDNQLKIRISEPISKESQIVAYITLPDLSRLGAANNAVIVANEPLTGSYLEIDLSSGTESTLELNYEKVNINLSSAAKATLHGAAEKLYAESATGSFLDARFFKVTECDITARSDSRAKVYVTNSFNATARSGSMIEYRGEPSKRAWYTSGGGTIQEEE